MQILDLKAEWDQLVSLSDIEPAESEVFFHQLCKAYSQPHRHYHTLQHIQHMLEELKLANVTDPSAYWAAWYHDFVYNPGDRDNEVNSAAIADSVMTTLSLADPMISDVKAIIEATKTHNVSGSSESVLSFVLDADMSILGQSADKYQEYSERVEAEFRYLPNFIYRRGRRKFLKGLLGSPKIYETSWFSGRYENTAIDNIQEELLHL